MAFRFRGKTELRPSALTQSSLTFAWQPILALGAPQSLNFIGLALGSAAIMAALQLVASPTYENTVSAYGIITRVLTFAFLPLLGLSHAMQTITGNNFGAQMWQRSNKSLMIGLLAALIYCAIMQLVLTVFAAQIGRAFVTDNNVIAEVARILPVVVMMFAVAGPLMMIATYFQAIGDAGRAALLSLTKPYIFAIPLTFVLASTLGEAGIWRAGPLSELMLLILTLYVLSQRARNNAFRWGMFQVVNGEKQ